MKTETTLLQTLNIPLGFGLGYLLVVVLDLEFFGVALECFLVYLLFSLGLLTILSRRYQKQVDQLYYGLAD